MEGYIGAKFRKFATEAEAWNFVKQISPSKQDSSDQSKITASTSSGSLVLQEEIKNLKFSVEALKRNLQEFVQQKENEIETLTRRIQSLEMLASSSGSVNNFGEIGTSSRSFCTLSNTGSVTKRKSEEEGPKTTKLIKTETPDGCPPFRLDEDGYVIVYTDGACESNGRKGAKAGIGVWFADSHPL